MELAVRKVNGPGVFVWVFAQGSGAVFAVWGCVLSVQPAWGWERATGD